MFRRRRAASDFAEELQAHLQIEMDRLRAEGLPEDDAYRQASRSFGNLGIVKEHFYESRRPLWLDHLTQDIRHAFRRLRKAPAFAITTILTLALGIGATTSIFTLVHAVLLKSLAVANSQDLYRLGKEARCCVWGGYSQYKEHSIVSYELYQQFRDHVHGFAELAAFQAGQAILGVRRVGSTEIAQSYPGEFVSGNYFAMFGVNAYAGRTLTGRDDKTGASPVAVISYRLWRKYGADPSLIGSAISLNGKSFTIIGIAPPGFYGDTLRNTPPDFFLPLATESLLQGDASLLYRPDSCWLHLIGRIQPGVTLASLQAQMRVELHQWLRSHWSDMDANARAKLPQQTLYLTPGGAGITSMREEYEHWLHILMIVSGFVLLIVCANVANLMLVRSLERQQQLSLSMALGARPVRLVRQVLTESLVLSILGGAAGLAIAFAGTRLILHFAFATPAGLARVPISASPSGPVLWFTFAISLLTGVAFGMAPAWLATRVNPIEALRGANRSTGRTGSLPRKTLVVLQAALSLVLLCAAGLLTATLRHLENQNFGFEQDRRTIVNIDPLLAGYRTEQLTALYRRIHDSLSNIPGVSSVTFCLYSPQSGDNWNDGIYIDGRPAPGPRDDNMSTWNRVTTGYFDVVGNRILKGRPITEQDTANSRHVAVINEAFARKFFKGEDPIGKHFGREDIASARDYEVVGVAQDARYLPYDLDKPIGPFFFVPESQYSVFPKTEATEGDKRTHYLHDIIILMKPGTHFSEAEVRRALAAADPNLPVIFFQSLREQVAGNFSQQRLIARLTSLFGILSLFLASVGLYGITAYNAGRRTREIGVRMALGANRGQVIALVLRGALALLAFGLLLGLPLALVVGRFLGHQLYGVDPYNPVVIVAALLALGFSASIASLISAFRTSFISPLQALRAE